VCVSGGGGFIPRLISKEEHISYICSAMIKDASEPAEIEDKRGTYVIYLYCHDKRY
jgi:hypothetical protein